MEHAEALERNAADLYVLGELSDEQADAFEDHFFDCPDCADDVRVGMNFLDGGRRMMREQRAAASATNVVPLAAQRRANVWMPIAVAAMLVVVVGGPILWSRAGAPATEVATGHIIDLSGVRSSADDETVTLRDGEAAVLFADIPPSQQAYARYELRLVDTKGKVLVSRSVAAEQATNTVPLVLRGWVAGTYDLVVVGEGPSGRAEVTRGRFIVKRRG